MEPVLETGILTARSGIGGGQPQEYVIRRLDDSYLPRLMALQEVIVCHLHCSEVLEPFSSEFMKEHLGKRGFALGLFSGGKLVAFRNVYYPDERNATWNLGIDIGLPESALNRVANLQMVCVHPDYRGNSLALKMNRIALRVLRDQGTHEHICATVSPYNVWNIRILLNSGFHIRRLKHKYGGKLRYVVYQSLTGTMVFDDSTAVELALDDLESQKRLLGNGHCGVALKQARGDDLKVLPASATPWRMEFRQLVQEPRVHVLPNRCIPRIRKENPRVPKIFGADSMPKVKRL